MRLDEITRERAGLSVRVGRGLERAAKPKHGHTRCFPDSRQWSDELTDGLERRSDERISVSVIVAGRLDGGKFAGLANVHELRR